MAWRMKSCPRCKGDCFYSEDDDKWQCLSCCRLWEKEELLGVKVREDVLLFRYLELALKMASQAQEDLKSRSTLLKKRARMYLEAKDGLFALTASCLGLTVEELSRDLSERIKEK